MPSGTRLHNRWPAGRAPGFTALLFDCLGTLLELQPPAPRLAAALDLPLDEAERRMRGEIAYYRAHMHTATDAASLAELRRQCAELAGCDVDTLLSVIAFEPYPEVVEVLTTLRARGIRLVVVSNWDVSLHEVLDHTRLAPLLDGAISSAEVGAAKPDPAPIHAGLALAGATAAEALMVGDSAEDVAAAAAAGVAALRLNRPEDDLSALLS